MFGKLLKHEWRATAPTLGLLNLAVLVTAGLGGIALRMMVNENLQTELTKAILVVVLIFAFIAMGVCAVAWQVILLVRFYRSRFTDQGYLTFTLPVNVHQVFLSSGVNMMIWNVISTLVLLVSFTLLFSLGLGEHMQEMTEAWEYMTDELTMPKSYLVSVGIMALAAIPYSAVIAQTCLTVGATVAKKHKILASVASFYVVNLVTSTLTSMLSVAFPVEEYVYDFDLSYIYDQLGKQMLMVSLPVELILIVGGYFLSTWLMKRHLNLP